MDNCLIILTNYYPFYKGEEYLESEIKYLSNNFKKIFILSTMVSNEMEQTRQVPENVVVLPIGIKHSKIGKFKMFIDQFRDINNDKDKKLMIKKDSKNKFINKLYCYYFESRAMNIYKVAEKLFDNYDFNSFVSITIYSYWLYITSRVGVELKNKYFNNKNVKVVSRAHRYDLYEYAAPLKYLPERDFLLKSIDKVYPCSQDGVDILNETYPKYNNKIEVRRLGSLSRNVVVKNKSDRLYIVSCSVVRKVKRLNLLIDSLVELEKKKIPYLWTHIGGGPEFERVKKLAEEKLNKNNFKFTGFVKNQEVLDWYKDNYATVFVNLSSSEGVPVAIMEAISMGLPVIATDVGGTREIVINDRNGYLLNKDCTIEQIVNSFIKIYSINKIDYKNMCNNALEIWNKLCNADNIYSDFAIELASDKNFTSEN